MIDYYPITALCPELRHQTAKTVAHLATAEPSMADIDPRNIYYSSSAYVALDEGSVFAGYIRAKPPVKHEQSSYYYQEAGTLITHEAFRGLGIAKQLLGLITSDIFQKGYIPCGLVNGSSRKIFESMGYEPAFDGELPAPIKSKLGNLALIYPAHKIWDIGPISPME